MKQILKYIVFFSFKLLGIYRFLRQKYRDKAIVLTYHGVVGEIPSDSHDFEYRNFVTVTQFEKQIKFLLKKYRPLKTADFYNSGAKLNRGFLITFDDGFRNNYRYAMPILKKYGLQACFFITTDFINSKEYLWTEQVTLLLEKTRKTKLELQLNGQPQVFELTTPLKKEKASQTIRRHLKIMPSQLLQTTLKQLKEQLNDVSLIVGQKEEERYLFMTWDEVREMVKAGQLIGGHTHTHPMLATLTEDECWQELRLCKDSIEKETGQPCTTLSYPNGEKENYNEATIQHLKKLGYKCAFTQIPLFNDLQTDKFQLHRVNISLKMSLPVFEATLCGFI